MRAAPHHSRTILLQTGTKAFRTLIIFSGLLILGSPESNAIIDSNENGVSDLWEEAHNNGQVFDGTFDPQADPDGDGWNNAQEASAGTNPFDSNPPTGFIIPEITHFPAVYDDPDEDGIPDHLVTPEAITITWPTIVGKQYTLRTSPALISTSWIEVDLPRIGDGSLMGNGITLTQPDGSSADKMFWQVGVSDVDTDGDSLTDSEEYQLDTDPTLADTDGDGLPDAQEVQIGSSPVLVDTDDDGIPDGVQLAAGRNPAGESGQEIYSVEFEVQEEWQNLDATFGFHVLMGSDDTKHYLTKVRSEEYTVVGSARYTDTAAGLHQSTESFLASGALSPIAGSNPIPTETGIRHDAWEATHTVELAPGETLNLEPTVTNVGTEIITATEKYTTTTYTTPWQVKLGGNDIRSGTEVVTITDRTKLSDATSYPALWALFKPWNWQAPPAEIYGPLEIEKNILPLYGSRDTAAESSRDSYKKSDFPILGTVSLAGGRGSSNDYCLGARLKSLHWRWVKFDPLHPFTRVHEAPPAPFRKQFNFSITRKDISGVWTLPNSVLTQSGPDIAGIVSIDCDAASGGAGWHDVPMSKFASFKQEDPTGLAALDYSKWTLSNVYIDNLPIQVTWQAFDDFDNVDNHIDPWNNPIYGKRIFPDFKNPLDATLRAKVHVVVKTSSALAGKTVFVKSFDVDDSTSEDFDLDEAGTDPVIDIEGKKGNDNFPDYLNTEKDGHFWNNITSEWGGNTATAVINSQGEATFDFRVGMQPGNNYRVVASLIDDSMYAGVQAENPEAAKYLGPAPWQNGQSPASPLLTVWRRLWVEQDSMWSVGTHESEYDSNDIAWDSPIFNLIGTNSIGSPQTTTGLRIPPVLNDRENIMDLENGFVVFNDVHHEIIATLTGSDFDVVAIEGDFTALPAGTPVRVYDDDGFGFLGSKRAPFLVSLVGIQMQNYFKTAFILPVNSGIYNENEEVPFKANIGQQLSPVPPEYASPDIDETNNLWVAPITLAYQGERAEDNDPFLAEGGITYGVTGNVGDIEQSLVFVETCRDDFDNAFRIGGNTAQVARSMLPKFIISTASHEIGHQPGYEPSVLGGNHHDELGIMREGGPPSSADPSNEQFSATTVERFRKSQKWCK